MKDDNESHLPSSSNNPDEQPSELQDPANLKSSSDSMQHTAPETQQIDAEKNQPIQMTTNDTISGKNSKSKALVNFLRILVIGGGVFSMFIIGLGLSFSACFTIKGPPPPECGPVSFVSLILMPGASLLFLIPLAKKIK